MADDKPTERVVTREEKMQVDQRAAAQEALDNPSDLKLDETVPGGRYLLDDGKTLVDANGKPFEDKK